MSYYKPSAKLQALLDARPGVRNLTNQHILEHVHGRLAAALAGIPEFETFEGPVPRRDASGNYERDLDGLVVCDTKKVSRRAHVARPILEAIESTEAQYIDHLLSYVDDRTARAMHAMLVMQMKEEGFTVPCIRRDDPEGADRCDELEREAIARNRETVRQKLSETEAGRKALALLFPSEPAPAPATAVRSAARSKVAA